MRAVLVSFFLVTVLAACNQGDNQTTTQKRDCDDLKGSSRIMAMNCE